MKFPPARLPSALLGLALVLTGCASLDTATPDIGASLPSVFQAEPEAGKGSTHGTGRAGPAAVHSDQADQWWTRFGDARLNALVTEAVIDNPTVAQAVARAQVARAQAGINRAERSPQISGGLSAARQRQNIAGLGPIGELPIVPDGEGNAGGAGPAAFTTSNFGLSVDISWELDLWGRLSAQSAAARADFLASRENLRAVRQSIAAQAATLYFSVVEARAQVALSERTVATLGEITRQINNRADAGIAAPSDRLLSNANFESARSGLEQRREALARLTRQLEVLLRDYPTGTIATADVLPAVPPAPPAGLPTDLLMRRPDVAATELALRAAGYRLTAGQRSFLPNIALTGSGGTASSELGNLLSGGSVVWSIAGRVLQPIFQAGRLRAQVDLLQGQREEAIETYAETALRALSEVETALAVDELLARREDALLAAASAAEEAVEVSFNRYREGIDPFLAVLESQQRALESRSAHIAARRARLENRIDLHLALGGEFEEPANAVTRQDR